MAAEAFTEALALVHNDLFALSGLVRAYAGTGEKSNARDAMAQLLYVSADSDPHLKAIERAAATGVTATARDSSPGPQRNYARTSLERFGPNKWEPYDAPALEVQDASGKAVTLADYRGKKVLLIFYLGQDCPHCVRQLHTIGEKKADWERLETTLVSGWRGTAGKKGAGRKDYRAA